MRKVDWTAATDWETVCRRNAGRRRYNSVRAFRRDYRRHQVAGLLVKFGEMKHGNQARIARKLGVSQGTISRDVQALTEEWHRNRVCPLCGSEVMPLPVVR